MRAENGAEDSLNTPDSHHAAAGKAASEDTIPGLAARLSKLVRAIFFEDSPEHGLEVVPRIDGVGSSPFKPNDIGFYLPSHTYESEDGRTPRSMAEPDAEWEAAVDDMADAVKRLGRLGLADSFLTARATPDLRTDAVGAFLADITGNRPNRSPAGVR